VADPDDDDAPNERLLYDQHNATVRRLQRAVDSHHPGQDTCDHCRPVLRPDLGGRSE